LGCLFGDTDIRDTAPYPMMKRGRVFWLVCLETQIFAIRPLSNDETGAGFLACLFGDTDIGETRPYPRYRNFNRWG
ncbi:MAG: hypothetical protein ACRCT1_11150, partial [Microcoleaceae cyanobacterium]